MTHASASYDSRYLAEIEEWAVRERDAAVGAEKILRRAGLDCPCVSVGSTPTALHARDLTGVTEVRAGVLVFFDLFFSWPDYPSVAKWTSPLVCSRP